MSLSDYILSLRDALRDPKNRYDMIDAVRAVLIVAATMALATAAAYFVGKSGIVTALVSGMAVSVLVYGVAVVLLGCLTREEAVQLPVIGRIARLFGNNHMNR